MSRFRTLLLASLVLPTVPLAAQDTPQGLPLSAPTATPTPVPVEPATAPLPTATPTPDATPSPTPSPTARATEPLAARPSPRPSASATSRVSSSPAAPSTPPAAPAVDATPVPTATPATPPVIASPLPTTDDLPSRETAAWPWMLGAAALLVGGIGLWLARRQRTPEDEEIEAMGDAGGTEAAMPDAAVVASVRPDAVVEGGTGFALRFRPTRVGFNMLSATAEGELTIVNEGDVSVDDLRVRTALLGAHAGQDADLAAFLAEPIGRPDVPPFALAPGEARTVRVLAAAPRASLKTMVAAERPMFVPVLAVNLRGGAGGTAQAFAIGAERVDSAKLAPFWLDVPDRAYTAVAARPHGPAIGRG